MDFRRVTPARGDKSVFKKILVTFICVALMFTSFFVYNITFQAMTVQSEAVTDGEKANETTSVLEGLRVYVKENSDSFEYLVLSDTADSGYNLTKLQYPEVLLNVVTDNVLRIFDSSVNTNETNGQASEDNGCSTVVMYKNIVTTEEIPYTSQEIKYDTSKGGRKGTDVTGQNGLKEVLRRQKYVDGVLTEDVVIGETVTQQPVNAVKYVDVTPATSSADVPASAGAPTSYSRALRVKFTAYTYSDDGGMYTSTGKKTRVGYVAVDPRVIPYHSLLYCVTDDGYIYGYCYAEDCGGAIKGNKIDLFLPTASECYAFGVRMGTCYVVTEG